MTQKAIVLVLKVSLIVCAARNAMEVLKNGAPFKFEVNETDVLAAWDVVKLSMDTYIAFKVSLVSFYFQYYYEFIGNASS